MRIISHRGYWKMPAEKNTMHAFQRSFALGFGTETDIRDLRGEIVISHDMPKGDEIRLEKFLALVSSYEDANSLTLALNIKSDGLSVPLETILLEYKHLDIFVFDMSVPDSRHYLNSNLSTYMRMSEVEKTVAWLEQAEGIWLDGFSSIWYDSAMLQSILNKGKKICIVSPELHGRDHMELWSLLNSFTHYESLILCTDLPEKAATYFENGCQK